MSNEMINTTVQEETLLEEKGKVIAVEGSYALIETQPRSACGHCNVGDSCGASVLAGLFSKRRNTVRLKNNLNLEVGETVIIGIHESVLLTTAIMAYMLPIILMIVFAVISNFSGYGDAVSFVSSMLGLFSGMHISNRIMGNKELHENSQENFHSREIILLRKVNESVIQLTD